MPDLTGTTQVRELPTTIRAAATDTAAGTGRELAGIAVPWNTQINIFGIREQFAPGSIVIPDDGYVPICYRHDEPVGLMTSHRDGDTGWEIDATLTETTLATDAAILLRDKVIRKLSIRFEPLEWTETRSDNGDISVTYTKAIVREVSLVPIPAYQTADITQVRNHPSKENPVMPETDTHETVSTADLTELRAAVDETSRRVALLADAAPQQEAHPLHQFRSFGAYAKALAAGDEAATRAFDGVVSGDVLTAKDDATWVGDMVRLIDARTPITNAFNHTRDLPSTGKSVEFGRLGLNTLKVEEQLNEGDDLVYGKIALTDATARIRTIGGWTDMSRQAIERSSINVVDLAFRGFGIAYANALESIARKALKDVYDARKAVAGAAIDLPAFDADTALDALDVLELLLELGERYTATGYSVDGLLVSKDIFLRLAAVEEKKTVLQVTSAPADKLGTLSISSVEANLSNVRVSVLPGADASTAFAYDRQAIKIQESPGAPFRLQDENIVNLTKAFSVYGYVAAYDELPDSIVPITMGNEIPAE